MINVADIIDSLGVTEQQVAMAIYSGRIPKPTEEGNWFENSIQMYLDNWKRQLGNKRKDVSCVISSGNMAFPKHQR